MSNQEAIEIINKNRLENSFTMSLSINEFVDTFRKRYLKIYNQLIPNDYISIAETMLKIDSM